MSEAESSSSASAADAPRKRALSPVADQAADAVAAPQPQPTLHSPIAPSPPKKARCSSPPERASSGEANARASAGPAASVVPRWSDLSPSQRCFSDGLTMIFSFLSLFELIPAALTCRSWRDVAVKVDAPGVEVRDPLIWPGSREVRSSSRLQSLASSPFRRHVLAFTHSDASTKRTNLHPSWDLPELRKLRRLPQLRRISGMSIEVFSLRDQLSMANATQPFTFPPLLESVDLHLSSDPTELDEDEDEDDWDWSTESVQRLVLGALRPCHSLTELSLTVLPYVSLCLDGLLELSTLRILTIDIEHADGEMSGDIESMFTEAQMGVVKRLPNLRRLTLLDSRRNQQLWNPLMNAWPRWLCSLPHRLQQLEELDLSQLYLQMEHMQLLQRLPALTAIEPASVHQSALPLLPAFASRLQRLRLHADFLDDIFVGPELFDAGDQILHASFFLAHLTPCTALTRLTLQGCVFSEAEAETLCRALAQLRDLDLNDVSWPSFESLRHLPLLESFSLQWTRGGLLHFDRAHLRPLQQLRRLTLIGVLPPDDDDDEEDVIDALRPPSALLPGLVEFDFSLFG